MFNIRLYIGILVRIIAIQVVFGVAIGGIVTQKAVILGCFGAGMGLLLVGELVYYMNRSNRRVQLFLDTIENRESMLSFPQKAENKEEERLHKAFNRVNLLIKELKMESREQELFFLALLQHIPGGVISWDESGRIRVANDVALTFLGLSSLHYVSQIEQAWPSFPEAILEAETNRGNSILKIEQNHMVRQLSLSLQEIILHQEKISILILQDIGRELCRKEFESWDRLTHVLTHEIMNSIAPIVSLSGTLLSYFQADEKAKTKKELTDAIIRKSILGLSTIRGQGERLMHFTDSYRRFSCLQSPIFRPFIIRQLIEKNTLLFHSDMERMGIHLSVDLPLSDIIIYADEEQLSQVLVNLIKNAMESVEANEVKEIVIKIRQHENLSLIEISDNGSGIPNDLQEDIFIPFFTTKSTGTGIGLSLSRQIIHMHKGNLTVWSKPYEKTCFTITLPIFSTL